MAECPGHCGHIELVRLVSHPGFIMKVKEVLETVFANCGKLKDDIARMAVVWRHCKTKVVCSTDEPEGKGAEGEGEEPKKGHGGCGHIQPLIRKEGLKMFVQYKETKYPTTSTSTSTPATTPATSPPPAHCLCHLIPATSPDSTISATSSLSLVRPCHLTPATSPLIPKHQPPLL
ncbi:hypothetical protein FA13DRAFT_1790800 [Coprinellus micaceus]|uniref:DNA-directed RNA polymerase n=1 Tax=Coprinellus micaceus TaxID=71717 RepID=A0A4Y7TEA5_COPMI|nr:hypothetical protein FA13DRAFT_1790800 [Coprinellus micaceus]